MAKILIVDDSRTSRKILRAILEEANFEVVGEAVNGQDGIDKYQELHPDIVTLDVTMPVLDGIGALKEIKTIEPKAKVIMITAAGQKEMLVDAVKHGASEFITKPFEAEEIVRIITKLCEA